MAAEQEAKTGRFHRFVAAGDWIRARHVQIAVFFLFVLFVVLTIIARSPALRLWDIGITHYIQRGENPTLTAIAEAFTDIGTFPGLLSIAALAAIWLWRIKKPWGMGLLVAADFGHLINVAIKFIAHRPRPRVADTINVLMPADGTSFPSGHAQAAVMFFGFLIVLVTIHVRARALRYALNTLLAGVATAICLSRIYLGAHFLSDVIGGIMCGLLFLWIGVIAYKRWGVAEFDEKPPVIPVKER